MTNKIKFTFIEYLWKNSKFLILFSVLFVIAVLLLVPQPDRLWIIVGIVAINLISLFLDYRAYRRVRKELKRIFPDLYD